MKKYKLLLLSLCLGTALMGCSSNDDEKSTNKKPVEKETVKEKENGEAVVEWNEAKQWVKQPFAEYAEDPIALYDKGFLVNDGNKEGFMGPDGNLILDMKFKFQECFMDDAYGVMEGTNDIAYLAELLEVKGYNEGCWTGIVGPSVHYYYDTENKEITVIQKEMGEPTFTISIASETAASAEIRSETYFLPVNLKVEINENGEEITANDGYVLVLNGKLMADTIYEDLHMKTVAYRKFDVIESMNAVKKDGKWAIMDKDGNLLSDFVYDEADVLNDTYVKVKKGDSVGLYTKDKKEYLYPDITSITAPVKDVVFAKMDGKWGLMEFAASKE